MTTRLLRFIPFVAALGALATPASAQRGAPAAKPPALAGTWMGTASVKLGDSTIVVPVSYTFTEGPGGITGTAFVPGQGMGPISKVVRDGKKISFTVTMTPQAAQAGQPAPAPSLLEHELEFTADAVIEGMVNLDKKPVAKVKITPQKK